VRKAKEAAHFDVEAVDADAQVVLVVDVLFAGVELFAFVDVLAAGLAPEHIICIRLAYAATPSSQCSMATTKTTT